MPEWPPMGELWSESNDLVFKNSIWSHIYSSFISQNARMKSIRGCCIGWYSELLKQRFAVIIISVAGFYSWSPSRSNCSDCHHKRISSAQSICNLVFFAFFVFNLVIEFKQFSHKLVLDALRDFLFCDVFKALLISFDQELGTKKVVAPSLQGFQNS